MDDILSNNFHPLPLVEGEGDEGVFKLSPSAIAGYLTDPALYYYQKVLKRKTPGDVNLALGSAVHAGIEFFLRNKLEGRPLPSLIECLKAARAVWLTKTAEMPPTPGAPFEETWLQLQNSIFPVLWEHIADLKPAGVEKHLIREHPSGLFSIHGYLDLEHEDGVICDWKSASKSPSMKDGVPQMSALHRLQLVFYAWLRSGGEHSVEVENRYIVKTKAPKVVIARATITPEEMTKRLELAQQVYTAIQHKVFTPNYGFWGCSPSKCPYWAECTGGFGGSDDGEG